MARKLLSDDLLLRLTREGKTDREILDYLATHENITVTHQAISAWRKRRGIEKFEREPSAMPWTLRPEHRSLEPARVIRWHARLERGEQLDPAEERRYRRAMDHMEANDLVIHYDRDSDVGWMLVKRRPGVDLGIVREPAEPRAHAGAR